MFIRTKECEIKTYRTYKPYITAGTQGPFVLGAFSPFVSSVVYSRMGNLDPAIYTHVCIMNMTYFAYV